MKQIQHQHLIIRAEIQYPPIQMFVERPGYAYKVDRQLDWLNNGIEYLIGKIGMKVVLPARAIWVGEPGNEGYTGQAGLETSHIAYHIWNNPDRAIMKTEAPGLLQFDVYTCGCLGKQEEAKIIATLDEMFGIVELKSLRLDRAKTL